MCPFWIVVEVPSEMFHELATLLQGSGVGFWTATESSFSQMNSRNFETRNCRCKAWEMRECVLVNRWPLDALEDVDRIVDEG